MWTDIGSFTRCLQEATTTSIFGSWSTACQLGDKPGHALWACVISTSQNHLQSPNTP